jgi:hypothetical protein
MELGFQARFQPNINWVYLYQDVIAMFKDKKNSTKLVFIFSSLFFTHTLYGKTLLSNFKTTRLKSTAGAGVASILLDESTVLNPASLVYFKETSLYIQKSDADLQTFQTSEASARQSLPRNDESSQWGVVVSDTKSSIPGSFSYHQQKVGNLKVKRFATAVAQNLGDRSSFGMSYRYLIGEGITQVPWQEGIVNFKEHQVSLGLSHILTPEWSIGVNYEDLMRSLPDESGLTIGTQYVFKNMLTLMADFGGDYKRGLSESFFYRGALQLKLLSDFYLRAGIFRENWNAVKGTGIGLGWVQPRLVLEAALAQDKQQAGTPSNRTQQIENKDISFSISYRF